MQRDLTTGSVLKNITYFSLPYLFSYFLQTLYGMADLFIIGQFEGVAATTAVSVGSQVMHMLTVILVGLAMGATVSVGQAVGAKNNRQAAGCVGNTVTLFLALSVVLTGLLLLLAALKLGWVKLENVRTAALFLIGIFPLLFVPAAAGVMDLWAELHAMLLPVLVALVPVTFLVMATAGRVTQRFAKAEPELEEELVNDDAE